MSERRTVLRTIEHLGDPNQYNVEKLERIFNAAEIEVIRNLDRLCVSIVDPKNKGKEVLVVNASSFPLKGHEAISFLEILKEFGIVKDGGESEVGIGGRVWRVNKEPFYRLWANIEALDRANSFLGYEDRKGVYYFVLKALWMLNQSGDIYESVLENFHHWKPYRLQVKINSEFGSQLTQSAGVASLQRILELLKQAGYIEVDSMKHLVLSEKGKKFVDANI